MNDPSRTGDTLYAFSFVPSPYKVGKRQYGKALGENELIVKTRTSRAQLRRATLTTSDTSTYRTNDNHECSRLVGEGSRQKKYRQLRLRSTLLPAIIEERSTLPSMVAFVDSATGTLRAEPREERHQKGPTEL